MDLGVSAWLHQCCANSDCNANSDNHLQSLGKEQSDQQPSSGLNSTMPLFLNTFHALKACLQTTSTCWPWPSTTRRRRGPGAQLAATSAHLRHSGRNTEGGQRILCEQMTADSEKCRTKPRVSCERLHRDVMDGARLFRRRYPADGALMAFQSEALNYGVELTAPARSWEASTTVFSSDTKILTLTSVYSVIPSIQIRKKQSYKTADCSSSHIWAGF